MPCFRISSVSQHELHPPKGPSGSNDPRVVEPELLEFLHAVAELATAGPLGAVLVGEGSEVLGGSCASSGQSSGATGSDTAAPAAATDVGQAVEPASKGSSSCVAPATGASGTKRGPSRATSTEGW